MNGRDEAGASSPRLALRRPTWWRGRTAVIGIPYAWLLVFFFAPFLIVLKYAVSEMGTITVQDLVTITDGAVKVAVKYANFVFIATDGLYFRAYVTSIEYAFATTALCLLVGYPFAYFMARAKPSVQPLLLVGVMLPFWTSFLLRVYAWKTLLDEGGWVASALLHVHADRLLLALGLIEEPGRLMHTPFSLLVGLTYTYLPFMVLPLYATLSKLDPRLLEAAWDLGATPWVAFVRVTIPLSLAGIVSGSMLVFIPCLGEFVTPDLLGGPTTQMIGRVIWDENFSNNDPSMASAVAVVLVVLIVVPLAFFNKYQAETKERAK